FKTMGIPLVAGRDFDDRDARFDPPPPPDGTGIGRANFLAAIVSESYAKHFFGWTNERSEASPRERSGDPGVPASERVAGSAGAKPPGQVLGRHIGFGINPGTPTPIEIVGVVKDAKYTGVRDDVPWTVYFPFLQNDVVGSAVVYVRTSSQPDAAFGSIRQVVRQLD